MTATTRAPRRLRSDDPIDTGQLSTDDRLTWALGNREHTTPVRQISAAIGRVRNSRDGLVLLDGTWVNESDLIALMSAVRRGYSPTRQCMACHSPLAPDGHCPTCVRVDTGSDY